MNIAMAKYSQKFECSQTPKNHKVSPLASQPHTEPSSILDTSSKSRKAFPVNWGIDKIWMNSAVWEGQLNRRYFSKKWRFQEWGKRANHCYLSNMSCCDSRDISKGLNCSNLPHSWQWVSPQQVCLNPTSLLPVALHFMPALSPSLLKPPDHPLCANVTTGGFPGRLHQDGFAVQSPRTVLEIRVLQNLNCQGTASS